jgi:hypothetical protein
MYPPPTITIRSGNFSSSIKASLGMTCSLPEKPKSIDRGPLAMRILRPFEARPFTSRVSGPVKRAVPWKAYRTIRSVLAQNRRAPGSPRARTTRLLVFQSGHRLLLVANSFVINPSLKTLKYDPMKSFEPVCLLTRSPNVIAVNSASPYLSLLDFGRAARARPGELTMAFQGPGTGQHVAF